MAGFRSEARRRARRISESMNSISIDSAASAVMSCGLERRNSSDSFHQAHEAHGELCSGRGWLNTDALVEMHHEVALLNHQSIELSAKPGIARREHARLGPVHKPSLLRHGW